MAQERKKVLFFPHKKRTCVFYAVSTLLSNNSFSFMSDISSFRLRCNVTKMLFESVLELFRNYILITWELTCYSFKLVQVQHTKPSCKLHCWIITVFINCLCCLTDGLAGDFRSDHKWTVGTRFCHHHGCIKRTGCSVGGWGLIHRLLFQTLAACSLAHTQVMSAEYNTSLSVGQNDGRSRNTLSNSMWNGVSALSQKSVSMFTWHRFIVLVRLKAF